MPGSSLPRRVTPLVAGMVLLVGTLAVTYPLWLSPRSALNDLGDARLGTWILAWDYRAFTTDATLFDANFFHPRSRALALSENIAGIAWMVAPLNWLGEAVLAYNTALWASILLTGLGLFLWLRRLSGNAAAALVAAVAWNFGPSRVDQLAHLQIMTLQGLTFGLWFLTRYADDGRRRDLVAAMALFVWQYWSGLNMTVIAAPLVLLFLWARLRAVAPQAVVRRMLEAAAAGVVGAVAILPSVIPYLRVQSEGMVRDLAATLPYVTQPGSFVAPGLAPDGGPYRWLAQYFGSAEANHFPGVLATLALPLVAVTMWRHRRDHVDASTLRRVARWVLGGMLALHLVGALAVYGLLPGRALLVAANQTLSPAVVAFAAALILLATAERDRGALPGVLMLLAALAYLASFGDTVAAADTLLGVGPFRFLHEWLLPYRSIRAVGRFGLMATLFLVAALGVALAGLFDRRLPAHRHALIALALSGALLVDLRIAPIAVFPTATDDDAVYDLIADLPGDRAVLHLPIWPGGWPANETEYMVGSTRHWKPLVNGFTGFKSDDLPRLRSMSILSSEQLEYVRARLSVDYIVVHGRYFPDYADFEALKRSVATSTELQIAGQTEHAVIYRVLPTVRQGPSVSWTFAEEQLRRSTGVELEVHARNGARSDLIASWGPRVAVKASLEPGWNVIRVPAPEPSDARADGAFRLTTRLVPPPRMRRDIGSTGLSVGTSVLVDAQRDRTGIALQEEWQVQARGGVLVATFDADVIALDQVQRFAGNARGLGHAARHIIALDPGRAVAIAVPRLPADVDPATLVESLGHLGLAVDGDLRDAHFAAIGRVGAPLGSGIENSGGGRAWIRVGPPAARLPEHSVRSLRRLTPGSDDADDAEGGQRQSGQ